MARRVMPASASINTVCSPARAVNVAALDPAGPPPTIATSYIRTSFLPRTIGPSGRTRSDRWLFPNTADLRRPGPLRESLRVAAHGLCRISGQRVQEREQAVGHPTGELVRV